MSSKRITLLEPYATQSVRERGLRYFEEGRVTIRRADEFAVDAWVRGTKRYSVALLLDPDEVFAACTCEHFAGQLTICKHIWATLLATAENPAIDVERFDTLTAEDIDIAPDEGSRWTDASLAEPEWRSFFRTLNYPAYLGARPDRSRPLVGEILYIIDAARDVRASLPVEIHLRPQRKDGSSGAYRRISPTARQIAELAEPDREILSLLPIALASPAIPLHEPRIHVLLPRLSATGRLFIRNSERKLSGPLGYDSRLWQFQVVVSRRDDRYQVEGQFSAGDQVVPLTAAMVVTSAGWFVTSDKIARFDVERASAWLEHLRSKRLVDVPASDAVLFAESLATAPPVHLVLPDDLALVDAEPRPLIRFERERADSWKATLVVLYGSERVRPSWSGSIRVGGGVVRRRADLEATFSQRLAGLPFRSSGVDVYHVTAVDLPRALSVLVAEGWQIDFGDERLELEGELELEVTSGIDWFDVEGGASFSGRKVALPRLLEAVRRNEPLIGLDGGGVALIPEEWRTRLGELVESGTENGSAIRFRRSQATLIDALLAARGDVHFDADFEKLRQLFGSVQEVQPREEPPGFQGQLRPYQRAGLGWLWLLREAGFGGCLADDMGLGKTIQALALLEEIRQGGGERKTSLIVAPRSLMFNWKAEAGRFAPQLRILDHHGLERVKGTNHFEDYDLILTTYGTLQRDIAHLASPQFEYVILDEAQAIKNADSQTARAVRTLRCNHRLALSGTPIENHLGELWSLFEFLNPGMLGNRRSFARTLGAKGASSEERERLVRIVRPFILRRTKELVLPELPAKSEQTLWVELTDRQRQDYDELREHYRAALLQRIAADGMAKSKMHVLEALLRLRQAALHPGLLDETRSSEPSAKIEALEAELAVLAEGDHKVLVFSQFTRLLDLVEERVIASGRRYCRLDGKSRNREAIVQQFQEDDSVRLFLISLRAGGVGLNLTAADYVFLLDPWWNPAVEAQAVDRAHRIGQQKRVFATRIVASGTVEEKILQLQEQKRDLADSIIRADDGLVRGLDLSDLEMLLS